METLELLNRKINTAQDLLSVVKTMKSLAAVSIRQYERAVESLEEYRKILDMGWQVLFRQAGTLEPRRQGPGAVCVILGSDQGMCGQFNEVIVSRVLKESHGLVERGLEPVFWAIGEKINAALGESGSSIGETFSVPGSVDRINTHVKQIVQHIESWYFSRSTEVFYLCHNILSGGGGYEQTFYRLLPLDSERIKEYKRQKWPGRCLPKMGLNRDLMFTSLFQQYLFVSLYRAIAQSSASENAARLMAMQAAEKNIVERKEELEARFRELRQTTITSELFDIISGFESLTDEMTGV